MIESWKCLASLALLVLFFGGGGLGEVRGEGTRLGFDEISRSQFATLDVRVLDGETGMLVSTAQVDVPRLAYEPERLRGRFRYERLRKGDEPFEVYVSAPGYVTAKREVLSPGEDRLITLEVRLQRVLKEGASLIRPEMEVLSPLPGSPLGEQTAVAIRMLPLESVLGSEVELGFIDGKGLRVGSTKARRLHGAVWGAQIDLSRQGAGAYRFYADVNLGAPRGRVSHLVSAPNLLSKTVGKDRFEARRPWKTTFLRPSKAEEIGGKVILLVEIADGSLPVAGLRFAAFRPGGPLRVLGKGRPSKDGKRWGFSWRTEGFLPGRYRIVATVLGKEGQAIGEGRSVTLRLR